MDKIKGKRLIVNIVFVLFVLAGMFIFAELHTCTNIQNDIRLTIFSLGGIMVLTTIIIYFMFYRLSAQTEKHVVVEQAQEIAEEKSTKEEAGIEETKNEIAEEQDIQVKRLIPSTKDVNTKKEFCDALLIKFANEFKIAKGVVYLRNKDQYDAMATYAHFTATMPVSFKSGDGLNGQAVKDKRIICIDDIPEGYVKVISGLGEGSPKLLYFLPLIHNSEVIGLIELASFKKLNTDFEILSKLLTETIFKQLKELT